MAVCPGPLGPCTTARSGSVLGSQGNAAGPGGATVFVEASGSPWIALVAWLPGMVGYPNSRMLFIRPLEIVNGQPVVCPTIDRTACG